MSFANLKSNADLASRRSEAARLLQVSIDNETYLEGKMKKYQDPRKIDEVPPQYKTYAELVADNIQQEQNAIKNLSELKIPYDMGSQIAQFLTGIGKLILFNASFPTIKADIMKRYNVKLLDVDFLKNYLNRFFTHLETSYGFTIDRDTGIGKNLFSSVSDAKAIIPTTDGVKGSDRGVLADLFELVQTAIRVVGFESAGTLTEVLRRVIEAMPTQRDLDLMTKLDEPTKRQLLKMLSKAFNETRCPVSAEVVKMNNALLEATRPAQLLVGSDELSQTGRDVYSASIATLLSQIELQFRSCGETELSFLAGVREAIKTGETIVDFSRKAQQEGNVALDIQEQEIGAIARDALEQAIGNIAGFEEEENRIIRRREYEEDLADEVISDAELNYFKTEIKRYIQAVESADLDVNYSLTMEGLMDIVNSGLGRSYSMFLDAPTEQVPVSARLRAFGRRIVDTLNRTGRSIEDLFQLVGGQSIEQRELEAGADIWNEDRAVRDYRGGEFNPMGRELLRDTGGGGAAQEGMREPEAPNYVPYDTWATIHRDLASKYSEGALIQLSRNLGMLGTYPDGSFQVNLPVNMTPEYRRKLVEYERGEEEYQAEKARRAREAPISAEEQARQDEFQRQQNEASRARLEQMRQADKRLEDRAFLERRMKQRNLYQADLDELVRARVNPLLKANGLEEIKQSIQEKGDDGKMKVKKVPVADLQRAVIDAIIALDERGVNTILRDKQTNMFGTIQKGDRAGTEFGFGMKRRIGGMMAKLPPMNPYDKKKFLETAEGREFMNHHPREKIMDRKFIEQHQDAEEGMGLYKMTRIPVRKGMVRKKIGGGIAVQSTPTYAEFGKYAIHLPQLHNKNTLNIKYKSLGAIPTLKPITISDDFKDFITETLEKKSVNERALKKLPSHEISYFERAVAGAGLLETFKMKRTNTDEEKKDLDRFTLLRGELIAGNNSDKLIKELRSLIVKFLNTGRIHKAEGMNLLQELSVL
jgi:hypothetical protein